VAKRERSSNDDDELIDTGIIKRPKILPEEDWHNDSSTTLRKRLEELRRSTIDFVRPYLEGPLTESQLLRPHGESVRFIGLVNRKSSCQYLYSRQVTASENAVRLKEAICEASRLNNTILCILQNGPDDESGGSRVMMQLAFTAGQLGERLAHVRPFEEVVAAKRVWRKKISESRKSQTQLSEIEWQIVFTSITAHKREKGLSAKKVCDNISRQLCAGTFPGINKPVQLSSSRLQTLYSGRNKAASRE
jgi:hypothetical protein